MTRDDLALAITPLVRHGMTVAAGFLAARGVAGAGDLVASLTSAGVLLVATLAWSFLEKNKLIGAAVSDMPVSALEQIASTVAELKKTGADPLLIAHSAQAVSALANYELAQAQPALVAPPPGAVAVVSPPAAAGEVSVPPIPSAPVPPPAPPAAPAAAPPPDVIPAQSAPVAVSPPPSPPAAPAAAPPPTDSPAPVAAVLADGSVPQ